jgi:hypothetical protein
MPGFSLVTNMDPAEAAAVVRKAGKRLDFEVDDVEVGEMEMRKGSLTASIFLGAFIAYCNFRVIVSRNRRNDTVITIERNSQWWTGIIGVNRVKSRAQELADEIEDSLRDQRADILHRDTF